MSLKDDSRSITTAQCEQLEKLGKLYADRCELYTSIEKYHQAGQGFWRLGDVASYLSCQNSLMRLYAETLQFAHLDELQSAIEEKAAHLGRKLDAKFHYTLGIAATYRREFEAALKCFQSSLKLALAEDNKKDVCYAINGLAITYSNTDRLEEALREIKNLEVFFQVMDLEEVRNSARILNAAILRKLGKFAEAQEMLWDCYTAVAESKNLYQYIFLLYSMGLLYLESGDKKMASVYIQLAQKSCDPQNLVYLASKIEEVAARLNEEGETAYDLIYEEESASLTERRMGRVHFRNQFVLMDLLKLFLTNPGKVLTKEQLVREVWKQDYNPAMHDNKIYVTIKRLRKLIEPDYDKPRYIFRGKNGYYLNKEATVYVASKSRRGGSKNAQV